ncbi:hypothetical protein D9M70_493490 [compost metagenome]
MKAAEIHEIRQLLKPNILGEIVTHVGGDTLDLPGRKATPWSGGEGHGHCGVPAQKLETDKIEKLLDEQVRYRVTGTDLVVDQGHDRKQFGIAEIHAVEKLGLTTIPNLIRAGKQALVPQKDIRHFDGTIRAPKSFVPPGRKSDGAG